MTKRKKEFEKNHEVIKSLRTYAQHHSPLPPVIGTFSNKEEKLGKPTIIVSLEDIDDFSAGDPEASLERIEGDHIDIEDWVNSHFESAEELVRVMLDRAEQEYEELIEDYKEATRYEEMDY